ncbi:MAG: hypothetical protein IH612_03855 [Desulfofustis sp.]|nr:hypothetical protein [Desulfofustis sp.]
MKTVFSAPSLFVILAALLLLAFFLPDLLGPAIGTAISAVIVLLAVLVYNRWCRSEPTPQNEEHQAPKSEPPT